MASSAETERSQYEAKKAEYLLRHIQKYPDAVRILTAGRVFGDGNEDWHNVAQHCAAVSIGGSILAGHLGASWKKVALAGLLHDWYVREERERMDKVGGGQGYAETAKEDFAKLSEFGIPDEIIKIAHANVPESIEPEYLLRRPIEHKIIHLMDISTSETRFIGYRERLRLAALKPKIVQFSESLRPQYRNEKNLFEIQEMFASAEQAEFERFIGLEEGTLMSFIEAELRERVERS